MSGIAIRGDSQRRQRMSRAIRGVRVYARVFACATRGRKLDLAKVIAFGVIGAFAQIGAIGALLEFLRLLAGDESGGPIRWHKFTLRPDLGGLMLASGVLAILLVIASLSSYFSTRRARAIGRAFTESSVVGLFDLLARAERLPEGFEDTAPRSLGVRASRIMGLSVETGVKMIQPAAQLVVLVAGLSYIDAQTTSLLLPVLIVPAAVLFRFNRGVRRSARTFYEGAVTAFGAAVGRSMENIDQHRFETEISDEAITTGYHSTPGMPSFFDSYDDIILASDRSILITSLFRPLLLVYVLMLLGLSVSDGRTTWPEVIAYMVLLLQTVSRAESLVAHVSVLNREYTQVEPYMRLEEHVRTAAPAEPVPLGRGTPRFVIGDTPVSVEAGAPVLIYTGRNFGRHSLWKLFDALMPTVTGGADTITSAAFIGRRFRPAGATFAQLATGKRAPTEQDLARLRSLASSLGLGAELDDLADQFLDLSAWDSLAPSARALLQLGPVVFSEAPALLVDVGVINQLPREASGRLLEALSDRGVIVLAADYRSWTPHARQVIALRDGRAIWGGPADRWLKSSVRENLRASADGEPNAGGAGGTEPLNDDSEL